MGDSTEPITKEGGTTFHFDEMHYVIGERLLDDLDEVRTGYRCVELVSSPAVVHVRLTRAASSPG